MPKSKPLPAQAYLRECFNYYPFTGKLVWKVRPEAHFQTTAVWRWWTARFSGKSIMSVDSNGYYRVSVNRHSYRVHRLVWKLVYGCDPVELVDHVNGDGLDNRLGNLRLADATENRYNAGKKGRNRRLGVYWDKQTEKWRAMIKAGGKIRSLGRHASFEDAVTSRVAGEKLFAREFAYCISRKEMAE